MARRSSDWLFAVWGLLSLSLVSGWDSLGLIVLGSRFNSLLAEGRGTGVSLELPFPVRALTISTQRELSAVSGLPGTKSKVGKQSFLFLC